MPSPNGPSRTDESTPEPARKGRPQPKRMTQRRMENIATFYIQRFATTAAHLKRVLLRRAAPALKAHGGDKAEIATWADEIVARFERTGIVDDARYAATRVASLARLGKGPGKIRTILRAKGVAPALINELVAELDEDEDQTLKAATAYAQRRRLGPFRKDKVPAEERRNQESKDLAALGRAGFSYAIAKRALSES